MKYLSVSQIAKKWNVSERSVRNYCAQNRVEGAFLSGKTWNIPENAVKPKRMNEKINKNELINILQREKQSRMKGGIYYNIQLELTYNSNHIEGSRLTYDQTRYIYETNTIGVSEESLNVDDIIETVNHFKCVDIIIDHVNKSLSESFIKKLHSTLKNGTSDSQKEWFEVGNYKRLPNEVGGKETTLPENVETEIKVLLENYNSNETKTIEDIIGFHVMFEKIHPFQDGNGRVGRLIMFKECLRNNIVPFIITDELKFYYYRGLSNWEDEKGYLTDTCLTAQDQFKKKLDYFRIEY